MTNLLPEKEKSILRQRQTEKIIMILGVVVFVGLFCLFLIFTSINIYLRGQVVSQEFSSDRIIKENKSPDFSTYQKIISDYNSDLAKIESFYKNQEYISSAINVLLGVSRPDNLYFTGFSFSLDSNDKSIKVSASGFSGTRDSLSVFEKNLKSEETIKNVYLPAESWVNQKDIKFSLTLEIKNG